MRISWLAVICGLVFCAHAQAAEVLAISNADFVYEIFDDADCNDEVTPGDTLAFTATLTVDNVNAPAFYIFIQVSDPNPAPTDFFDDVTIFSEGMATDYGWWVTDSNGPEAPNHLDLVNIPTNGDENFTGPLFVTAYVNIDADTELTSVTVGARYGEDGFFGNGTLFGTVTATIDYDAEAFCFPPPPPPSAELTIEFAPPVSAVRQVGYTAQVTEKLIVTNNGPEPVSDIVISIFGIDGDNATYAACASPFPYFCSEQSYADACRHPQCFTAPHAPSTRFNQILNVGESVSVTWSFQIGGPPDSKAEGYEADLDAHYYVVATATVMLTAPTGSEEVTDSSQSVTYYAAGITTGVNLDETLHYKLDIRSDLEDELNEDALGPVGALFGLGAAWLGARSLRRRRQSSQG